MSIERRWNRNEVSRESPDKEVNLRPTSLKKFRADALMGPRVSIATGWNYYYYYYAAFNVPCVGRKDGESQARLVSKQIFISVTYSHETKTVRHVLV